MIPERAQSLLSKTNIAAMPGITAWRVNETSYKLQYFCLISLASAFWGWTATGGDLKCF